MQIYEELGYLISATKARANLAAIKFQNGLNDEACSDAIQTVKLARKHSHLHEAGSVIRIIALIMIERGRKARAFQLLKCAMTLHTETHDRNEIIENLLVLIHLLVEVGNKEKAQQYLEKTDRLITEHGQHHQRQQWKKLEERMGEFLGLRS